MSKKQILKIIHGMYDYIYEYYKYHVQVSLLSSTRAVARGGQGAMPPPRIPLAPPPRQTVKFVKNLN